MNQPEPPGTQSVRLDRGWPTPGAGVWWSMALAGLLEVLARVVAAPSLSLVAAGLVGLVVTAGLLTPQLRGAFVSVALPARGTDGERLAVAVTLTRRRSLAAEVTVKLTHPGLSSPRALLLDESTQEACILQPKVKCRGSWIGGGALELQARSPLGGWRSRARISLGQNFAAHPRRVKPLMLRTGSAGPDAMVTSRRLSSNGDDFSTLRDWQQGDAAARVHWRASARRDRLVVAERERPGQLAVVVLATGSGVGQVWETAVAWASATCVQACRDGGRIEVATRQGLVRLGNQLAILDAFAALETWATTSIVDLPRLGGTDLVVHLGATELSPKIRSLAAASRTSVLDLGRLVHARS